MSASARTIDPQIRRSDVSSGECAFVPVEFGPGQSFSGHDCFGMPEANAAETAPLELLVTSPDDVQVFALDAGPEKVSTCASPRRKVPSSFVVGGTTYSVLNDQTISVPGTADGTINLQELSSGIDRVTIEASGGETITIRVTPSSPSGSLSWLLVMYDSLGVTVFRV